MFPKESERGGLTCMKGGGSGFKNRMGGMDPWRLEEIEAPDVKETKAQRENRQRLADAASARKQKAEREEQEEKARTRAARFSSYFRPSISAAICIIDGLLCRIANCTSRLLGDNLTDFRCQDIRVLWKGGHRDPHGSMVCDEVLTLTL